MSDDLKVSNDLEAKDARNFPELKRGLTVPQPRRIEMPSMSDDDDETWNWLIDLGAWVKAHGPRPGILKYSIPTASEERTWRVVEHSALSIESALETTESE
jgi:hypothetical protein